MKPSTTFEANIGENSKKGNDEDITVVAQLHKLFSPPFTLNQLQSILDEANGCFALAKQRVSRKIEVDNRLYSLLNEFSEATVDVPVLRDCLEQSNDLYKTMTEIRGWLQRHFPPFKDGKDSNNKEDGKKTDGWKEKEASSTVEWTAFDAKSFVREFQDPWTYFMDEKRPVGELYQQHVKFYLMNRFPNSSEAFIDANLTAHNGHLMPTLKSIMVHEEKKIDDGEEDWDREIENSRNSSRDSRVLASLPQKVDQEFVRELQCIEHEQEILALVSQNGVDVQMCECCCSTDFPKELMIECSNSHFSCVHCVREHAHVQIAQGASDVSCIQFMCDAVYEKRQFEDLLEPQLLDGLTGDGRSRTVGSSSTPPVASQQLDNLSPEELQECEAKINLLNAKVAETQKKMQETDFKTDPAARVLFVAAIGDLLRERDKMVEKRDRCSQTPKQTQKDAFHDCLDNLRTEMKKKKGELLEAVHVIFPQTTPEELLTVLDSAWQNMDQGDLIPIILDKLSVRQDNKSEQNFKVRSRDTKEMILLEAVWQVFPDATLGELRAALDSDWDWERKSEKELVPHIIGKITDEQQKQIVMASMLERLGAQYSDMDLRRSVDCTYNRNRSSIEDSVEAALRHLLDNQEIPWWRR